MEVSSQLQALYALTTEKNPNTQRIGGYVGRRTALNGVCIHFLPLPRFEARIVQPVANRYTDYAIPAEVTDWLTKKLSACSKAVLHEITVPQSSSSVRKYSGIIIVFRSKSCTVTWHIYLFIYLSTYLYIYLVCDDAGVWTLYPRLLVRWPIKEHRGKGLYLIPNCNTIPAFAG